METPCLSFIGIVDFSEEAKWIYMTESVTDLLGFEPHELIGKPSLELVHPDEFPRVKQLHYDTIQLDKAAALVYLRMRHKDPFKGYILCGVSRTVVHNVLVGSVSFATPEKAMQNASTAQEITVIAPGAANFQLRRWHDPSPMPPSPDLRPQNVTAAHTSAPSTGAASVSSNSSYPSPPSTASSLCSPSAATKAWGGSGPVSPPIPQPSPHVHHHPQPQSQRYHPSAAVSGVSAKSPRASFDASGIQSTSTSTSTSLSCSSASSSTSSPRTTRINHLNYQHHHHQHHSSTVTLPPLPSYAAYLSSSNQSHHYPSSPSHNSNNNNNNNAHHHHQHHHHPYHQHRERDRGRDLDLPLIPTAPLSRTNSNGAHRHATSGQTEPPPLFPQRARPPVSRRGSAMSDDSSSSDLDPQGTPGTTRGGALSSIFSAHNHHHHRSGVRGSMSRPGTASSRGDADVEMMDADDVSGDVDADVEPFSLMGMGNISNLRTRSGDPSPPRQSTQRFEFGSVLGRGGCRRLGTPPPPMGSLRLPLDHVHELDDSGVRDAKDPGSTGQVQNGFVRKRRNTTTSQCSQASTSSSSSSSSSKSTTPSQPRTPTRDNMAVGMANHAQGYYHQTGHYHHQHQPPPHTPNTPHSSPPIPPPPAQASSQTSTNPNSRRTPTPPGPPTVPRQNVITFSHLPNKSFRTAFILNRFSLLSTILYCSNDLFISTTSAIGRSFFDFVAPKDENVVKSWIGMVKSWGINESGQPSDGGFGFGRFVLLAGGRDSERGENGNANANGKGPRNRQGSRSAATGQANGHGLVVGGTGKGSRNYLYSPYANHRASTSASTAGSYGYGTLATDPNEQFEVDAIFSAHSDGLMVIVRRAPSSAS